MLPVLCLALSVSGVERSHHIVLAAGVVAALADGAVPSEAEVEVPAEAGALERSGVLRLPEPWR